MNNTIDLEKYKRNLNNKSKLDDGSIDVEELSTEELNDVTGLYLNEIDALFREKQRVDKEIERMRRENEELRMKLGINI